MKNLFIALLLAATTLVVADGCRKDSEVKVNKNHRKSPGSSSNDILSSDKYKELVVEIQYMSGFKPTDQAITLLREMLSKRVNKPEGIDIIFTEIAAQGKGTYSSDEVRAIEQSQRTSFTGRKDIALYVLFLDGDYAENSANGKVLGIAYYNTSIAIFEKSIRDLTGGLGEPSTDKLESTVLNHEFGHLFGLVNIGSPMVNFHQDTDHGSHCDNSNCLMYWEAETGGMVDNLVGGAPIPDFDENCIQDMRANGGK